MSDPLAELLTRYVAHCLDHGRGLPPEELCPDRPELWGTLAECIRQYEEVEQLLENPSLAPAVQTDLAPGPLPEFPGFRTVERLGRGGCGQVYKLQDLQLGRIVAAKVLAPGAGGPAGVGDFLREARSLALFDDPRIVRIHEFRAQADPPMVIMEYVDGFELGEIGPSLEVHQRARIMAEIAEAVHQAHELGIQHRDLKPANIMLDAGLRPKILDFGLSRSGRSEGHGLGTPAYMAPEQLDPAEPIDARTDVYALGVVLYELLCGALPFSGADDASLVAAIREGRPRLPVEIDDTAPEPLQAIALKAMEREPDRRYPSARELALDLRRYLEGRPVTARPSQYLSALSQRVHPHREQIAEWLRLKLIFPHEAEGLLQLYQRLENRAEDWIIQSRTLSFSQISLYLGAFLLVCGSLLYFNAYLLEAVTGLWRPLLVLGLPIVGLNATAAFLFRRERRIVAVAFYLAGAFLLPLCLLIVFREAAWWPRLAGNSREFFPAGGVSNREMQVALAISGAAAGWLAIRTRTIALSTVFAIMLTLTHLSLLADSGLRLWIDGQEWDTLALHLVPLLALLAGAGYLAERRAKPWLAQVLYVATAACLVLVLELLALNGRTFHYLGLSFRPYQPQAVSDPLLLDTLAAMTVNGLIIYLTGWSLDRFGTALLRGVATLFFMISPFTILEPLAYLCKTGEYSRRFDWIFLGLALGIACLSHFRQRKSFYFAGLVNLGLALYLVSDHYEWFDQPPWAIAVVSAGLVALVAGYGLDTRERRRGPSA